MNAKAITRPRKPRPKDEMKQEIVAQVHKILKREQSVERENINKIEQTEESSESQKTFILEDRNENYTLRTPSRDVSVDGETQINSKILNLIETEMRRDINKHSHFTDSRPQSLSFYEEEKIPEELSGNLELLSPEERKHYRRKKEYGDIDLERNAYNNIQDALSRENDEIINGSAKKSKSRKKKHIADPELGLGDSREMMIPKEKKKSKKKKREYSPLSSSSGKRKHRKRDEDYEPKNEITLALDELQDDVFENPPDDFLRPERLKKSPRKSDKLYIQRKNKFEVSSKTDLTSTKINMPSDENFEKRFCDYHPVHIAIGVQKRWISFNIVCHGLLGGLGLAHYFYLYCNAASSYNPQFIMQYAKYSDFYTCIFYFMVIVCLVSVFDRFDVSHIDFAHIKDLIQCRKSSIVIIIYAICLMLHLLTAKEDDKISLSSLNNNQSSTNISQSELQRWTTLSYGRAIFASLGWIIVACSPSEDMFYVHLKNMEKYVIQES